MRPDLSPLALDAATQNGIVTSTFTSNTMGVKLDLKSLIFEINEQVAQMQGGNKSKTEALLYSQAMTLNAIFLEMARRAAMNMNEHINATETYMRIALKAQNQVRMTLETINNMKNPPVVIAKQANISAGHQQINNVVVDPSVLHSDNLQNQLSLKTDELHQDTRAQGTKG